MARVKMMVVGCSFIRAKKKTARKMSGMEDARRRAAHATRRRMIVLYLAVAVLLVVFDPLCQCRYLSRQRVEKVLNAAKETTATTPAKQDDEAYYYAAHGGEEVREEDVPEEGKVRKEGAWKLTPEVESERYVPTCRSVEHVVVFVPVALAAVWGLAWRRERWAVPLAAAAMGLRMQEAVGVLITPVLAEEGCRRVWEPWAAEMLVAVALFLALVRHRAKILGEAKKEGEGGKEEEKRKKKGKKAE